MLYLDERNQYTAERTLLKVGLRFHSNNPYHLNYYQNQHQSLVVVVVVGGVEIVMALFDSSVV